MKELSNQEQLSGHFNPAKGSAQLFLVLGEQGKPRPTRIIQAESVFDAILSSLTKD